MFRIVFFFKDTLNRKTVSFKISSTQKNHHVRDMTWKYLPQARIKKSPTLTPSLPSTRVLSGLFFASVSMERFCSFVKKLRLLNFHLKKRLCMILWMSSWTFLQFKFRNRIMIWTRKLEKYIHFNGENI